MGQTHLWDASGDQGHLERPKVRDPRMDPDAPPVEAAGEGEHSALVEPEGER